MKNLNAERQKEILKRIVKNEEVDYAFLKEGSILEKSANQIKIDYKRFKLRRS